jgi:cell division protein FtsW
MINFGRTNTNQLALWWRNIDKLLFILIISLMFLGIFFAYASTSSIASEKIYKTDYFLIAKHILFASISFLILASLSLLDAKQIEKYCILGFIITSFLLLSVLIFGVEVKGSKRWINLIFFRFQPVEIYKPFFILLCSLIISNSKIGDLKLRIFYSFCVLFFSLLLLLNQPDVGQSLLIFSVWLILIFISGVSIVLLISLGSVIFIGITSVILLFSERFSYIFRRLKTFIDPNKGDNLQTQKALDAIKQGGFTGRGIGEGILKERVPEAHTDFVLAVIGEEFGILMILLIFLIITFIFLRVFSQFNNENNLFRKLALIGLSCLVYLQSIINLGVTLNILPNKGMTFPFISYGGSSMIGTGIIFGILLCFTKRKLS